MSNMAAAQFNQLMTAIRGVATEVHAAQQNMNMRLDAIDHQITDIRAEIRIPSHTNSTQPTGAPPSQGGFQNGLPAQPMLPPQPFANVPIIHTGAAPDSIVFALQQIKENCVLQFYSCGKPKGLPDYFRARHFDWCFNHSQHMVPGQVTMCTVGKDPRECKMVYWDNMSTKAWAESVADAKSNGIGSTGVKGLDRVLFPDYRG